MQAPAAALGTARVVDKSRHLTDVLDARQQKFRMGMVAGGNLDGADPHNAFDDSLFKGDVVNIDHFDAVGNAAENARFVNEALISKYIADAHPSVDQNDQVVTPEANNH